MLDINTIIKLVISSVYLCIFLIIAYVICIIIWGIIYIINNLKELREYRKSEEQGLLLRFPCKPGDTVYYPWIYDGQSGVAINEVKSIIIFYNHLIITVGEWESDMYIAKTFTVEDIGKIIFFTQEEAEQRLREMGCMHANT